MSHVSYWDLSSMFWKTDPTICITQQKFKSENLKKRVFMLNATHCIYCFSITPSSKGVQQYHFMVKEITCEIYGSKKVSLWDEIFPGYIILWSTVTIVEKRKYSLRSWISLSKDLVIHSDCGVHSFFIIKKGNNISNRINFVGKFIWTQN